MAKGKQNRACVVPHTHWDREWRYPIWTNRVFLVEMMDELLDVLERHEGYRSFVTDGQCVLIEDYLEVRPENADRVRGLVAAGRLDIGPWYTLPDLYPIAGECLVRNLLRGIRVSEALGRCMMIGYNSFGWGQIAQFPQIYHGFGIEFIIAAKRVSHERAPRCEFLWESPDGTRVLTTRLGQHARANVFFNAYIPVRFGMPYDSDAFRLDWARGPLVIHNADAGRAHEDHFAVAHEDHYHREQVAGAFRRAWEAMDETTVPHDRLLLDGSDFTDCQASLPRMLADANELIDDVEFVHGSLPEYAGRLREQVDADSLPVVTGELRDGPACHCSGNALATRMYIKMLNKQAENALLRRAEPLATLMATRGAEYPAPLLRIAWTHLLQAHPHDSINGVTQDKTAEDTVGRLRQALEIGEIIEQQSVAELIRRLDLSACAADDVLLVAVNPLPQPAGGVVKLCVDLPREQSVWDFVLEGPGGEPVDVQPVSRDERTAPVSDLASRPWPFYLDRHVVWADLGELPPGGYRVFRVAPTRRFDRRGEWWPPMRTSAGGEISQAPSVMENRHLRVEVAGDGTFALTDKAGGRAYAGLHWFEDAGDVGDYWAYYPPYGDAVHDSRGGPVRIWREDNGPLAATIAVEVTMTLPARARAGQVPVRGGSRREGDTRALVITSRLTLRRDARRLDVRTTVLNNVEDHRLRVMLPTGLAAGQSRAAGHFNVDSRPVEPQPGPDGLFWPEMQTLPMQQFVDVSDGEHGLGVVHDCLTEYEVLRDPRTTLALTLLRAVRNRICTEFRSTGDWPDQKGGQCLREMTFRYALCPHAGDWAAGGVFAEAEKFNTPPAVYQASPRARGDLPAEGSLLAVRPEALVVTALKKAEDRHTCILRLHNPTPRTVEGSVHLAAGVKRAWLTDLNERRAEELTVGEDGAVPLLVPTCRIVTLELEA